MHNVYYLVNIPDISTFFFFNDTATTEIYTLSLHDALPILMEKALNVAALRGDFGWSDVGSFEALERIGVILDRKSTRLNSSHSQISYAVFCLKKKNTRQSSAEIRSHSSSR